MDRDYSPYLTVSADGKIWWELEDARKLGAGCVPVRDQGWRNTTNSRGNEITLIGAMHRDHPGLPRLVIVARGDDEGRFKVEVVAAQAFLSWLKGFIGLGNAELTFPTELEWAVQNAESNARRPHTPDERTSTERAPGAQYVAYPRAMELLAQRLNATPEEMAAWISNGHVTAYLNPNELDPPPLFRYGFGTGSPDDFDYLSPTMACWFLKDDIDRFKPLKRYITGAALIERWSTLKHVQPEAFIRAKIAESRLMDAHPICGLTQGTNPGNPTSPPLSVALFALSDVEEVEAKDMPAADGIGNGNAQRHHPDPDNPVPSENSARIVSQFGRGNPANRLVDEIAGQMEGRDERVTVSTVWVRLGELVGRSIIVDTKDDAYLCQIGEDNLHRLSKDAVRGVLDRRKKRPG